MNNRDRTYLGEVHGTFRLVVVSDRDEFTGLIENVGRLAPRGDLAPALPERFDWSAAGNPLHGERLAVALLADALRQRPDGDELAVRLAGELWETTLRSFPADGFRQSAWALERWAAERAELGEAAAAAAGRNQP